MRILVIVLAFLSVAFAGTTVYFARELQLERERPHSTPAAVAQVFPSTTRSVLPQAAPRPVAQQAPQSGAARSEEEQVRQMQADQARQILSTLSDPQRRESLLVEYKLNARNSYPHLAKVIGLSKEEADRLFTLVAQQQVDSQERYSRCIADPACDFQDASLNQPEPRAQEIADLLGGDRQQQFETYKNTLMERESVAQLRNRLPDSSGLPDDSAEALISALADERQKIHTEAAQRGGGMNGYGAGVGVIFSSSDSATPEAQIESARANSRRMHDRAAGVLTADQLRVFDEMQEELMISMGNQVRRKEEFATNASANAAAFAN